MNLYPYIAGLALLGLVAGWGVWQRGEAEHWHQEYSSLQASYQTAAIKAQDDARAQEHKAEVENQRRADAAVTQAYAAETHAEAIRATYTRKLAQLATQPKLDLGHQCALTPVPPDLLP